MKHRPVVLIFLVVQVIGTGCLALWQHAPSALSMPMWETALIAPVGYHRCSKRSLPPFHSGLMAGHEQLRARSDSISQALQFRLTAAGSGDVVVDLTMRSANVHGWLAC